jgi:hypothetical protein
MWLNSLSPAERHGACAAGAAIVVGLILAALITHAKIGDSATFIALLLVPLLVYGIVSGKLREFSGPGGWGAKFQEAAADRVKPTPVTACIQDIQVVQKGGMQALQQAGQNLESGKPIALTLQLGKQDYDATALRRYIEVLRIADPEATVLFLDQAGGLVAYAEATTILGLLEDQEQSNRLIEAIRGSNIPSLRQLPGFCWQSITKERSNAQALQLMRELNARTVVVVDNDKRPVGVVKRDHIIAELLVELAGVHTPL